MAVQQALNQTTAVVAIHAEFARVSRSYLLAKRAIDIIFSLLVLIPLCLIALAMAIIIPLDSPGRVIYRQRRVGQHGKEFYFLKFRSMYENNDDSVHRMAFKEFVEAERKGGDGGLAYFSWRNDDPRVTRVGRFIRKTSIDELPQFWNVLVGHMTLVGPRPPLPHEVDHYGQRDWLRLSTKPGITGPYQVYARAKVPFKDMVEMDIAYLQRQSILEDLRLIFLTVPVMLFGKGGA